MENIGRNMREMGNAQAKKMRDKARSTAVKRKEEYLGARVPKMLRDKVIDRANELEIPVSILIRNILEQAFSEDNSPQLDAGLQAKVIQNKQRSEASVAQTKDFSSVIGWDQIELNRDMNCSSCDSLITVGSQATLGLVGPGEDRVILCALCKKSV